MTSRTSASKSTQDRRPSVTVDSLGGIDHCELEFPPGLTVFEGRNATNRTSLLASIAGALGGSAPHLKTDADEGHVELRLEDTRCRREYHRENGSVRVEGEPYTDRQDLVDTFVSVLATNPIRQSVTQGGPLRDHLMRPVDTERIQQNIQERKRERDHIVERVRELERELERLPRLRERRSDREAELAHIEDRLEQARDDVAEVQPDEEDVSKARKLVDDLESTRQRLQRARDRIRHQSDEIATLREDAADLEAEFDGDEAPTDRIEQLDAEKQRIKNRQRSLTNQIDDLLAIVSFNDDLLDGGTERLPGVGAEDESPTAQLAESSDAVVCWTCGARVEQDEIADRLEGLREIVTERRRERDSVESTLDEIEAERTDLVREIERREEQERELAQIRQEIEHREEKRETLRSEATEIEAAARELRAEVDSLEDARDSEFLERYERISELEYERGQVKQTISDLEAEIETLEDRVDTKERLEGQVDELDGELESLRTRIERLETEIIDEFNAHMAELIDRLGFRNVARVWLERKVESPDAAVGTFSLHIVRESGSGSVYEDTVETLSESERELIGLVLVLAGYLVHDVDRTVPVMLLDSVEAIDGPRIADLLEYLESHVQYLLVALLPEDVAQVSPTTAIGADAI